MKFQVLPFPYSTGSCTGKVVTKASGSWIEKEDVGAWNRGQDNTQNGNKPSDVCPKGVFVNA
ncbi:MAG: hypothetical protein VYA53_08605 [Acidobacteriota bacterium]|nr:hypothetical protein [Acidobacteriota bacterium]